eukprot:IDg9669t1
MRAVAAVRRPERQFLRARVVCQLANPRIARFFRALLPHIQLEGGRMMDLEAGTDVGNYIVVYNPLCGVPGASLGTIFSVYYRKSAAGKEGDTSDLLQRPGYEQVAAGYCMYGSSTFLVFSMGYGVHMFTLDAISGHFVLAQQ